MALAAAGLLAGTGLTRVQRQAPQALGVRETGRVPAAIPALFAGAAHAPAVTYALIVQYRPPVWITRASPSGGAPRRMVLVGDGVAHDLVPFANVNVELYGFAKVLLPGDRVVTGPGALITLRFDDGSIARLGEQTVFLFRPRAPQPLRPAPPVGTRG